MRPPPVVPGYSARGDSYDPVLRYRQSKKKVSAVPVVARYPSPAAPPSPASSLDEWVYDRDNLLKHAQRLRDLQEELFGSSDSSTNLSGNMSVRRSAEPAHLSPLDPEAMHPRWYATPLHTLRQSRVPSSAVLGLTTPPVLHIKEESTSSSPSIKMPCENTRFLDTDFTVSCEDEPAIEEADIVEGILAEHLWRAEVENSLKASTVDRQVMPCYLPRTESTAARASSQSDATVASRADTEIPKWMDDEDGQSEGSDTGTLVLDDRDNDTNSPVKTLPIVLDVNSPPSVWHDLIVSWDEALPDLGTLPPPVREMLTAQRALWRTAADLRQHIGRCNNVIKPLVSFMLGCSKAAWLPRFRRVVLDMREGPFTVQGIFCTQECVDTGSSLGRARGSSFELTQA